MVHRQFRDLDRKSFLIIYKGFIRPHLEYAIQTWSPYQKGDIEHLEKVQRRATRLVKGYRKLSYEERLRKLGLTTLQTRRLRGDLIETFKIITGKEQVNRETFFQMNRSVYDTRGHCFKLATSRSRLEVRRNFFSQRVISHWNRLPAHVVEADTVNTSGLPWGLNFNPHTHPIPIPMGIPMGIPIPTAALQHLQESPRQRMGQLKFTELLRPSTTSNK